MSEELKTKESFPASMLVKLPKPQSHKDLVDIANNASPGNWVVVDVSEEWGEGEYDPSQTWYWVWQEHNLHQYGGVAEPGEYGKGSTHPDDQRAGAVTHVASHSTGDRAGQDLKDAVFMATFNPQMILKMLAEIEELKAALPKD